MTTQERETKTYQTPLGKELVLKTYLTGREKREIDRVYYAGMKMKSDVEQKAETETSGAVILDAQDKMLRIRVVSYDGSADNAPERLLDAPEQELAFALEKIEELDRPLSSAKTTGGGVATSPDTPSASPKK